MTNKNGENGMLYAAAKFSKDKLLGWTRVRKFLNTCRLLVKNGININQYAKIVKWGEGRREKGEGRREKGEGRRERGEGRGERGEELIYFLGQVIFFPKAYYTWLQQEVCMTSFFIWPHYQV
jgi:hypothetical protein